MLYQLSYVGVYSREIVVSNAPIVNYQFSISPLTPPTSILHRCGSDSRNPDHDSRGSSPLRTH